MKVEKSAERLGGGNSFRMSYDSSDPFAVNFTFLNNHAPEGHPGREEVEWVFGRDLLREGVKTKEGEVAGEEKAGDIRIKTVDGTRGISTIEFKSPYGYAIVSVNKQDLSHFLTLTEEVVPEGRESEHYDIDKEIAKIRLPKK
jgi:hypothetical protein